MPMKRTLKRRGKLIFPFPLACPFIAYVQESAFKAAEWAEPVTGDTIILLANPCPSTRRLKSAAITTCPL